MNKTVLPISIYSISHFVIDFSSAFLIFNNFKSISNSITIFLLYNFCAFALQMPIGLIADRINKNSFVAAIGCVLGATAYIFIPYPLVAVIIAGVANALFHIGGGIDILNLSTEKSAALGIFVSPGAFGIYFGTLLGKHSTFSNLPIIITLILTALIILIFINNKNKNFLSDNNELSFNGLKRPIIIIAILCLFIVVCLRSYVGLTLSFPWKSQGNLALILCCAVVFGKMAGGFLSDKIGMIKASVLSLGIAALLFPFSKYALAGILAVFFFNMTMPITLFAVAKIMKNSKGFSFGILTFGLFIGLLPIIFSQNTLLAFPLGYGISSLISLIILLIGIRGVNK